MAAPWSGSLGGSALSTVRLPRPAVAGFPGPRDFHGHLLVYVLVNAFLVVIWAVTSPDGFFWPIFPIVGWGIGVVMNAWDVYFAQDIGEREIQREIDHMLHRR